MSGGPQFEAEMRGLWRGVLRDIQQPDLIWQIASILAALAIAWLVNRAFRTREKVGTADSAAMQFGLSGLKRVLFPLVAVILLAAARAALRDDHNVNLLNLAVPLLGSLALIRAFVFALRQVFGRSTLLAAFERSIAFLVWGAVALHILGVLDNLIGVLDDIGVTVARHKVSIWMMIQAVFWVGVMLLLALWVGSLIQARLMRAERIDISARLALARLAQSALVLVAVLISLPLVGIDPTVLSVFGGAIGVGLGFGLQKVASNYVSGFIVLLDRSIRPGDQITADGFNGQVKQMTTRYTVLRARDGREAIVPNETLITQTVINHSFVEKAVRAVVPVQVSYASDLPRALALLTEVAAGHARVLANPSPGAAIAAFGENGITVELAFWTADGEAGVPLVRSELSLAIWQAFKRDGIGMPVPRREVWMADAAVSPAAADPQDPEIPH